MHAAVFEAIKKLQVKNIKEPKPKPGEVIVKTHACGICATDVHIYDGEFLAKYPVVGGHEMTGEIVEIGEGVDTFKVGDRVTVDPHVPCGKCFYCKINRQNHCLNWNGIGITRNGGFGEYAAVPQECVYSIGDLSYDVAAFVEPLSCVVYGLDRVQVQPGDEVLIFGAGPIGMLLLQGLKQAGASKVIITDRIPWRLKRAEQLGATETILADEKQPQKLKDISPLGYDIVVDASGNSNVVEGMFPYARSGGKILFFGVCSPHAKITISPYDVYRRDLQIYGSFALNRTFVPAIRLLQQKKVITEPVLSHQFQIKDMVKALGMVTNAGDSAKIQITY